MNQVMTIFLVLGVIVYSVESSSTPDGTWMKCRHDCFTKYKSCQMSDSCHDEQSCHQCHVKHTDCVNTGCP
uniref:Acrorhagin 1 n=1 Tax=Actinia equina TaxID=6106 RepID=A0A6C0WVL7_ACTEQ|nr:acrorhagin 1 [Actinia equina]